MATTVTSRLFAALAAVFILASCSGGGSDVVPQATTQSAPFVGTAVQGSFDGATRRRALAATFSEVARPTFNVTSRVTTPQAAAVKAQSLAAAGEGNAAPTPDQLFDWAEGKYPDLFPSHQVTRTGEYDGVTYDFRGYPVVGGVNHVGVAKSGADIGGVYGIGPFTGSVLVRFGKDVDFRCQMDPVICGPKLVSAKIVNMVTGASIDAQGATGVAAKGARLVLTYDSLSCAGVGGTGVVGQLVLTISCAGSALTFVPGIPGEERWTFGSDVTVTASGLRNAAGYPSAEVSVTFSTKVAAAGQGAKVYTGNQLGSEPIQNLGNVLSVFEVGNRSLAKNVDFSNDYDYSFWYGQVVVDPVTGVIWVVPTYGSFLYRIDLESGSVLQPIWLGELNIGTRGMNLSGDDVCLIRGMPTSSSQLSHPLQNSLVCINRFTLLTRLSTGSNVTGDADKILLGLFAVGDKLYIPAVDRRAAAVEPPNDAARGRDGWLPGYEGTVTEIDPKSLRVTRTFQVGSAPTSLLASQTATELLAFNMGDKTVSAINLKTGVVRQVSLAMKGFERPSGALSDWEKGRIYVSDDVGAVRILNATTLQEVGRINLDGETPAHMVIVQGKLWVACYKRDTFYRGDKVVVVDRDRLVVESRITTRSGSTIPDFQANMPYAITAYDPGQ